MEQLTSSIPLSTPLQNIGMAFSGGGFRAASFCLGTLSYLQHIQTKTGATLLQHVSFISSASGGTITNAGYTSYQHQGKSFQQFYHDYLSHLSGDKLLEHALSILNDDKEWKEGGNNKQRNLINAFAKVYDRILFKGDTLDVYWNKSHVKEFEVCFNATEFYRGQSFRFQTTGTDNAYQVIGNKYLYFDTERLAAVRKLKLADILASSSCFPMGFEPIVYPQDFTYQDANGKSATEQELKEAVYYENYEEITYRLSDKAEAYDNTDSNTTQKQIKYLQKFGLMDGGITDNQGLNSVMLADKKRRARKIPTPFDLIIVTDVASYFMNAYEVPVQQDSPEWRKKNIAYYIQKIRGYIKGLNQVTIISAILLLVSIVGIIRTQDPTTKYLLCALLGVTATVLALMLVLRTQKATKNIFNDPESFDLKTFLKNSIHIEKFFSDSITDKLIRFLKLTRLGVLEQMLKARISSVMTMVSDVNLKQVRRLIYQAFYSDPMWDNRRMPNFIYELSTFNINCRTNRIKDPKRLTWTATSADKYLLLANYDKINAVAEDARLMGTTLWFDETDMKKETLKKLVATGQFTTCANLVEYLISLERKGLVFDPAVTQELYEIKDKLMKDLETFKENPYWLYEEMGK